ncbi:MAG: hypothetical protein WDO19_02780 [Bacteroidota bacterium]
MIYTEMFTKDIDRVIHFLSEVDSSSYFDQMNYLNQLNDLIRNKQYDAFFEKANGSELWGGSGSIWESEYGMSVQQRKIFEGLLISLLKLLKENNKMEKRAKSVFKILTSKN